MYTKIVKGCGASGQAANLPIFSGRAGGVLGMCNDASWPTCIQPAGRSTPVTRPRRNSPEPVVEQQQNEQPDPFRAVGDSPPSAPDPLRVLFAYDSSALSAESSAAITNYAARSRAAGRSVVTATGYASDEGSDSYNLALAQRRADAVASALRAEGMTASSVSRGETSLVLNPDGTPNREASRRVMVTSAADSTTA